MTFVAMISELLDGIPMRRNSWDAGEQIQVQRPDEHSKMTQPYLYFTSEEGVRVPYMFSQVCLFATDWEFAVTEMHELPNDAA